MFVAALALATGFAQDGSGENAVEVPLHEPQSWSVPYPDPSENPFDVLASAVFTHVESGITASTDLFWIGDGTYEFRFTPTLTGLWTFETRSDAPPLDGIDGALMVRSSDLVGALTGFGNKFAYTNDGTFRGALHHTYHLNFGSDLADYPADLAEADRLIRESLDHIQAQGFSGLFFTFYHSVFELGARSYRDHDRTEPDLVAFRVVDLVLEQARLRGMTVHIWMWGDERRRITPTGLSGGVHGPVDRRLQRYIAARLGPVPGWTMAYGFDLEEWASADWVRDWADNLQARMQLPHLLTAREKNPRGGFDLGDNKLSLFSVDDRPHESGRSCYELAVERLTNQDGHEPKIPVLFERRFTFERDDYWSETRTRRCIWQLTMAGGAGSVWGESVLGPGPSYPTPTFYQTFFDFWQDRFLLDLDLDEAHDDLWSLATANGRQKVIYAEGTSEIRLDLTALAQPSSAIAVDTLSGATIDLGTLSPGIHAWVAPKQSDWAIAVGEF